MYFTRKSGGAARLGFATHPGNLINNSALAGKRFLLEFGQVFEFAICYEEKLHMRRLAVLLILFFSSATGVLRAQSTNASITRGSRRIDPSKAVIVDAKVAAINAGTNARYEGATNDSGEFYLTNLPPGSYRIEIEKAGFKKLIKPDVNLHVQDALEIDFEMTLGASRVPENNHRGNRCAAGEYRAGNGQHGG